MCFKGLEACGLKLEVSGTEALWHLIKARAHIALWTWMFDPSFVKSPLACSAPAQPHSLGNAPDELFELVHS